MEKCLFKYIFLSVLKLIPFIFVINYHTNFYDEIVAIIAILLIIKLFDYLLYYRRNYNFKIRKYIDIVLDIIILIFIYILNIKSFIYVVISLIVIYLLKKINIKNKILVTNVDKNIFRKRYNNMSLYKYTINKIAKIGLLALVLILIFNGELKITYGIVILYYYRKVFNIIYDIKK